MVISELALGFLTNFLYDSSKKIPGHIFNTYSKVYNKAIKEFSNKKYNLTEIQIETFFHQDEVKKAIEKYLKNPNKLDCSNILINEFFELFSEEDFSREDADLILNSFFEIIDAEIEKEPELIKYLDHQDIKEIKKISHKIQEILEAINGGRENQDKKELDLDFEKSLEKYLNKIIDEDGKTKISQVYTELSAKEILPETLKLHYKDSDKTQEHEIELIEKEEHLIISGESGSGKTITLKWLNFIFATKYLENKEGSIPLYVELNSYIRGPFYNYFKNQIKKKGLPEVALKALLEEEAIIFLDGFDLLSSTENFSPHEEIKNFIAEYSNCRFIVSSRPGFFGRIINDFKVWELEKLTDKRIQIFIKRYIEEKELAEALTNKILNNPELKSILTNPMMLYLVIRVVVERKRSCSENSSNIEDSLPQNRSEIYKIFVSDLFKYNEKSRKPLHTDSVQIENALTDLFFELQCKKHIQYKEALQIVKKHADDPIFRKTTSQDIIKDCSELGLLKRKDAEVEYGIHQSFQEYFAAIKLKEIFESGSDISEAFSHPKWEEVVIFTSEMIDSDFTDEFIGSMLLKGELFLASKCVNKASDNTKEKLCALLADKLDSKFTLEKIHSIQSLGNVGYIGINLLIETLADEDPKVRKETVKSLTQIGTEKTFELLAVLFKDENSSVRGEVANLLGHLKDERALELLINAFAVECPYVQCIIVEVLIETNYAKKIELLIKALDSKDSGLRSAIIYILGEVRSEEAEKVLKKMINDDDSEIREEAAEALRKIKPEIVDEKLKTGLEDQNSKVQKKPENSLKKIKSQKELKLLAESLNDDKFKLLWKDIKNLGQITSEEALEPLIKALKNKVTDKRFVAARALGNIRSNKTVGPLIEALNDKEHLVRRQAAYSLGHTKSERAFEPLIKTLYDENYYVRTAASRSLRNCCNLQNKKQLDKLLKSENKFVRNTAFEILNEIEKEEKSKLILFKELKKRSEITTKYGIFVSSVQKELENERVTIQDFVDNDPFLSAHYTSLLYEYEPAYPEKTLGGCLSTLNSCQIYLLIVGVKYGTLVGEISITHREYRYAKEKNLPILVFIKGDRNTEREPGTQALLREIDSDDFKYKRFKNVIELKNEVNESLKKLLRDEDKFLKT
ncbi:MAG TPA: HEAT repeat domain-containing protein [Methanosarcina sp.]|jgi:predicted NACHT family NTPase